MTNITFVLTFALTALNIYQCNLVKMMIGQELLSVGLNLWLISAGITIIRCQYIIRYLISNGT